MKLQFVGCGDAFGSGGRLNTCFHLKGETVDFLIDCGASAVIGLKKHQIDRSGIKLILITHFHADHFGGIPFFVLDAQFSKRSAPLTIAGPPGLRDRYARVMETAFPGSSNTKQKFGIEFVEIESDRPYQLEGVDVVATPVVHGPPDQTFYAYRVSAEDKTVAYSGDTQWTDRLVDVARNADLLIAEAYYYQKRVPFHLSFKEILENAPRLLAKRIVLTHMNEDMLCHLHDSPFEAAQDGMTLTV